MYPFEFDQKATSPSAQAAGLAQPRFTVRHRQPSGIRHTATYIFSCPPFLPVRRQGKAAPAPPGSNVPGCLQAMFFSSPIAYSAACRGSIFFRPSGGQYAKPNRTAAHCPAKRELVPTSIRAPAQRAPLASSTMGGRLQIFPKLAVNKSYALPADRPRRPIKELCAGRHPAGRRTAKCDTQPDGQRPNSVSYPTL